MNIRQKKKYWKNHVMLVDVRTGKRSILAMKDYEMLLKIAGITKEEHEEISSSMEG